LRYPRYFFRRFLLLVVLTGLSGCASLPPPRAPVGDALLESFHLFGRVSVRYGNEGFSGSLDWRHGPARDEVLILSPLGQGVAQLMRDETGVTLTTADQQVFRADDAESLTEQVLGWRFPLAGLSYWVQARAVPGEAAETRLGDDGFVDKLTQDGWQVEYAGHKAFAAGVLPGKVFMESADLRLKLVVDEWQP
jgi:outer membrane lipoprotein LolB